MSARLDNCAHCRFWDCDRKLELNPVTQSGECRRHPPPKDYRWPHTVGANWCGAFEARGWSATLPAKSWRGRVITWLSRPQKEPAPQKPSLASIAYHKEVV